MENLNSNLRVRSLEEEVVGQIERHPDNIANPGTYNPVTCETHNASSVWFLIFKIILFIT